MLQYHKLLKINLKFGRNLNIIFFVGDDWYKTESWQEIEQKLAKNEVKIIYFPYTHGTSSTIINNTIDQLRIDFSKKIKINVRNSRIN